MVIKLLEFTYRMDGGGNDVGRHGLGLTVVAVINGRDISAIDGRDRDERRRRGRLYLSDDHRVRRREVSGHRHRELSIGYPGVILCGDLYIIFFIFYYIKCIVVQKTGRRENRTRRTKKRDVVLILLLLKKRNRDDRPSARDYCGHTVR